MATVLRLPEPESEREMTARPQKQLQQDRKALRAIINERYKNTLTYLGR